MCFPSLPSPSDKAMESGHCHHLSLIFYARQWRVTFMKAKQIPAEKCSHGKRPQVGRGKNGQPFPSCASALLGQLDWTASKAWLNFLVLGIILLILPLATHQVIRFSSQALGLPDSKLFDTRLGFFSSLRGI